MTHLRKLNYRGLKWILWIGGLAIAASLPINFCYSERIAGDIQTIAVLFILVGMFYWAGLTR